MVTFNELIADAVGRKASDLHLTCARPPACRVDGSIISMGGENLTAGDMDSVARSLMSDEQYNKLQDVGEVDFAYSLPEVGRFRINVFRQRSTTVLVARVLNTEIPPPEKLGVPASVVDMIHKRRGLVLVTGPTGSGKSTTLASLINIINHTYNHHIITLEDPIEYLHRHNKSIVSQREVGNDTQSFANGLRAALRQDPDVILVGEMRDVETIATAVTAAETGHLVFSTLHTIGAANTIDRIIDVFPPYQQQQIRIQLADVIECVVSQQLLPKSDDRGRVAAIEVMLANSAVKNLIREAKTFQIASVLQTNRRAGMQTMDDALLDLYYGGSITRESAESFAQDLASLRKRMT